MGRSQKERFETCEVVPIQLASELGTKEEKVVVGTKKARNSSSSSEKRPKNAEKPIYIDRV